MAPTLGASGDPRARQAEAVEDAAGVELAVDDEDPADEDELPDELPDEEDDSDDPEDSEDDPDDEDVDPLGTEEPDRESVR